MTDAFYNDLRDNAVYKVLQRFGFDMVIKSNRAPVIDPDTGEVLTAATVVSTTVTGIFRFYSQDEVTGKDIQASDIQALIEAKTLNEAGIYPDTDMQLTARGVTYNIVRNTPTQPGGIPLLFRLQIRK